MSTYKCDLMLVHVCYDWSYELLAYSERTYGKDDSYDEIIVHTCNHG